VRGKVRLHSIPNSALDKREVNVTFPVTFHPAKKPQLHRRLGGSQYRLDVLAKRKVSCPCRDLNSRSCTPSLVNTPIMPSGLRF